MPEIEAQGGERILASPTEACPCKTFLAHFPYCTHFDFGVLPDSVHLILLHVDSVLIIRYLIWIWHVKHELIDYPWLIACLAVCILYSENF